MSKNIAIKEGGTATQLTVDKLKTNLVGGGSCTWVPEDEVQLMEKSISANGTYRASNDGYYGYSVVNVSGVGTAVGKDSDGDEAYSYADPGTGMLVSGKLPSSIRVTTPPTKTSYNDNQTIDFTGMVVKAYTKSGALWTDSSHPNGVIPISELTLPETHANYLKVHSSEYTDGEGVNAMLVAYNLYWNIDRRTVNPGPDVQIWLSQQLGTHPAYDSQHSLVDCTSFWGTGSDGGPTSFYLTRYGEDVYWWGSTQDRGIQGYLLTPGDAQNYEYISWIGTSASTGTGELKHMRWDADSISLVPESTVEPHGTEQLQPVDPYQSIPVQWYRPGDDKQLKTEFGITVTPLNM